MPVSNPVRRALEAALKPVAEAIPIAVAWPNVDFDKSTMQSYARCSFHDPSLNAMTMGTSPRVQRNGFVLLGVFTRVGIGADLADKITGEQGTVADPTSGSGLLKAYPYAADLVQDGVHVRIDVAKSGGDPAVIDGWWYSPTQILWNVWRAT